MKKLNKLSIYLECLFTNPLMVLPFLLLIGGLALQFSGIKPSSFPLNVICYASALYIFLRLDCGIVPYRVCKSAYKQMESGQPYFPETYCQKIGYRVAARRFQKNHPEQFFILIIMKLLITEAHTQGYKVTDITITQVTKTRKT